VAPASVLVLTGPPGSGKSTVGGFVAGRFSPSAHVESDWFWTTIVGGHVPPWLPEADTQNRTVLRAFAAAAGELARGGYTVVVDGIVGPWYLDLVTDELGRSGAATHYLVLRPPLEVALARARSRAPRAPGTAPLAEEGPIREMWERFQNLGAYERHVLDNGDQDETQTAEAVWRRFVNGTDRL